MIPDEVLEGWAAKYAETGWPDVGLPYPSTVPLVLEGRIQDRNLLEALQWQIRSLPEEVPLDMGAARCRELDKRFVDASGYRGLNIEASWIATDESLSYVSPHVSQAMRWPWGLIKVTPSKQGRRRSRFVVLTEDEGQWEIGTGTVAMANLLAIYSWSNSP